MKHILPLSLTLVAATMLCGAAAFADTLDVHAPQIVMKNTPHHAPTAKICAPGDSQKVDIVSGGIGEDEIAHLQSIEKQYDLKLMFTEKNGTFISDVAVHIEDLKGHTVADTTADGPIMLARLPTGKYRIRVQRHEEVKVITVAVSSKKLHARLFSFSNTDDRDSGDPRSTPLK